jgi:phosphopantetheinyl transferase
MAVNSIGERPLAQVWIINPPDLEMTDQVRTAAVRILSPDEQRRSYGFISGDERNKYLASRIALRVILSDWRQELIFGEPISRSSEGKPHISVGPNFSFSATPGLALVAICPDGLVGIDVERVRDIADAEVLIAKVPALGIRASQFSGDGSLPSFVFLKAWTMLEAELKLEGRSLGPALSELSAFLYSSSDFDTAKIRPVALQVQFLDVGHGYVAACASRQPVQFMIEIFDWNRWGKQSTMNG